MRHKIERLMLFSVVLSVIVICIISILWKYVTLSVVDEDIVLPYIVGCTFTSEDNQEDCVIVTYDNIKSFSCHNEWIFELTEKKCKVYFDMVVLKGNKEYYISGSLMMYYDKNDCMSWRASGYSVEGYDVTHVTWVKFGY